jgi:hypothetical protein
MVPDGAARLAGAACPVPSTSLLPAHGGDMGYSWRRTSVLVGIALATLLVVPAAMTAPRAAAAANPATARQALGSPPKVTEIPPGSGSHGYPYDTVRDTAVVPGGPTINLASYGYAEREFLMSGSTNTYSADGSWSSNGVWNMSVAQSGVPYTTRLLVRYPANPAKFTGTVVVEWLNDTTGEDEDPIWSEIYQQVLSRGDAYVGVTAQTVGMSDLKTWDAKRYGTLGDSSDGQSYDIYTQAARAIRADAATLLGGLAPAQVIGAADSQSAFRVVTYVNAFQPLTHAFSGFLTVGRSAFAAPLGNGLFSLFPAPAYIRADNATPLLQLNTQGDNEDLLASLARQPGTSYLRTWELAGASHIDLHEGFYEANSIEQSIPGFSLPRCTNGVVVDGATEPDNMGLYELEDAALAALQNWIRTGSAPAQSRPVSSHNDLFGNALGGIRLPDIAVPTETYEVSNSYPASQGSGNLMTTLNDLETALNTGSIPPSLLDEGLCQLEGYFKPFSTATLQSLYPTHADYVAKYKLAAAIDLFEGFLTPADYNATVAAAAASSIP